MRTVIDSQVDAWARGAERAEHLLGYLLQWIAVLKTPVLADQRAELLREGGLSAESAMAVFNHLVEIPPGMVIEYVGKDRGSIVSELPGIKRLAARRLVAGLPPGDEGPSVLRNSGLLSP